MARRMRPFQVYAPITRVDEQERIAEGYAFVNEVVEGEGGVRLLRSTMEAATPDYLRWGAVREMHQPVAAGVAMGVEWDDRGAFLRAHIVDDQAWEKVKAGVYKGFSLGIVPRMLRGNQITQATWIENSLVDRPKDPDAIVTAWRLEGSDPDAEVEVEEEPLERALESDDVPTRENLEDRIPAVTHYDCGSAWGCCGHTTRGGADECRSDRRASLDEQIAYLQSQRGTLNPLMQRLLEPVDQAPLLARVDAAESQASELRTQLERSAARVRELEAETVRRTPVVRFPQALEREFPGGVPGGEERARIESELRRIQEETKTERDDQKRHALVTRIVALQAELMRA